MEKILLVEDDPHMLRSLERVLLDEGLEVRTASSGMEAIELAESEEFALVVTDVRMPGMDGLEALGKLGDRQPDLRKVVITGYAGDDAPIRAIHLSVDDYLMKPFSPEVFLKSVREALSRHRQAAGAFSIFSVVSVEAGKRIAGPEGRARRMAETCLKIGRGLGLSGPQLEEFRKAALLHDLGFVSLPDQAVIDSPAEHARMGSLILSVEKETAKLAPILRSHHERYDAGGDAIPLGSRVLSIAEAYEILISQKGMKPHEAVDALMQESALAFDPAPLEVLSDLLSGAGGGAGTSTPRSFEALLHLAQVYTLLGGTDTANAAISKLLSMEDRLRDPEAKYRVRMALVKNLIRDEKFAEAESEGENVLQTAISAGLGPHLIALALLEVALSRLLLSSDEKVDELLEKAGGTFRKFGDYLNLARKELYHSFRCTQNGEMDEGKKHLDACAKIVEENGIRNFGLMESVLFKRMKSDSFPFAKKEEDEIQVYSFGPFRVSVGGKILQEEAWKSKRAKILLVYLLFNSGKSVSETKLCDLFWPSTDPERSRKNLHHVVYLLRRTLEPALEDGNQSRYILSSHNTYQFNASSGSWWDVLEFRKTCERARGALEKGEESWLQDVRRLEELYAGDLLEDYPEETWSDFEREKLKKDFLNVLSAAAALCEKKGEIQMALEFSGRALRLDPFHEKSAIRQIGLLLKSGQRPEAIRRHQAWCEQLKNETGLAPSQEFLTLLKQF